MKELRHKLGLPEDAPWVEVVRRLREHGVPLALFQEGEGLALAYMERYGPLKEVSKERMRQVLRGESEDLEARAALWFLSQDVKLPEGYLRELAEELTGKGEE